MLVCDPAGDECCAILKEPGNNGKNGISFTYEIIIYMILKSHTTSIFVLRTDLTVDPNVPFVAGEADGAANSVDSGSSDTVDYPEHETSKKLKILNRLFFQVTHEKYRVSAMD